MGPGVLEDSPQAPEESRRTAVADSLWVETDRAYHLLITGKWEEHDGLLSGTYFCRMISGVFTATQRFVVIE